MIKYLPCCVRAKYCVCNDVSLQAHIFLVHVLLHAEEVCLTQQFYRLQQKKRQVGPTSRLPSLPLPPPYPPLPLGPVTERKGAPWNCHRSARGGESSGAVRVGLREVGGDRRRKDCSRTRMCPSRGIVQPYYYGSSIRTNNVFVKNRV